jgi:hypothetical protein
VDWRESVAARRAALLYAELEERIRELIDSVAAEVCPACLSPCCRYHYCRPTARNPWYAFINEVAGSFAVPEEWERRRDPFGLGSGGCRIRAGRYVFCYSYNCPRLLAALPAGESRRAFVAVSELLLPANRLPGGRLLHELGEADGLTAKDLDHLASAVVDAGRQLEALRELVARGRPVSGA